MQTLVDAAPDFLAHVHERARLAGLEILRQRAEDCPRCTGLDSDVGRDCTSRGCADPCSSIVSGTDDDPICRWAAPAASARANREQSADRADRLRRAGCTDARLIALCRGSSLVPPPQHWLGSQEVLHLATLGIAARLADGIANRRPPKLLVVFSGTTGCGKSLRAAWSVASCRSSSFWLHASALRVADWDDLGRKARDAHLLVVDDLGSERQSSSGWERGELAALFLQRLNSGKPTIATTNLDEARLLEAYGGERLASRFAQDGAFVRVVGPDLRPLVANAERRSAA